jgi:Mg-chelatase subunit ChlD
MAGLRVHPIRGAIACLSLLVFLSVSEALAQATRSAAPATLRLAQVVFRLPVIHLYASAQDERGNPVAEEQWGEDKLSALIGPNSRPVKISRQPDPIAIVFLIDISKSLTQQQFAMMKAAVRAWIASLGPNDRAAIVTLGSRVTTVQDFTSDHNRLNHVLNGLEPRDMRTLLYQGLVQAIDISRRLDFSLPLRRAIAVLTDGMDDQQGGAGRQEVLDKLAVDPTPIYGLGASLPNNAKVDAALKDFSGLVRASGGEYRRIDLRRLNQEYLNQEYLDLRKIVASTKHLTAECNNPPCAPDASTIVVRLYLSQGPTRLSSQSVTVRSVGPQGVPEPNVSPTGILVLRGSPPEAAATLDGKPAVPAKDFRQELSAGPHVLEISAAGYESQKGPVTVTAGRQLTVQYALKPLKQPSPQSVLGFLLIPLLLIAGGAIAGIVVLVRRRGKAQTKKKEELPKAAAAAPEISDGQKIDVVVSDEVKIAAGTHQDKQRLRLYPIGHSDIGPFDLLFEDTLSVGRSPESAICISNDGQVSASHCTLSPRGKSILVQDVGSRNGTRVNGVAISGFLHAEPDSILGVGRTELRMKLVPVGDR